MGNSDLNLNFNFDLNQNLKFQFQIKLELYERLMASALSSFKSKFSFCSTQIAPRSKDQKISLDRSWGKLEFGSL